MQAAYTTLLERPVALVGKSSPSARFAKGGKEHPRIIALGGDHTIVNNCSLFTSILFTVGYSGSPNPTLPSQGLRSRLCNSL